MSQKYKYIRNKKMYKSEHRVIVEKMLGRELRQDELVHHIDGNKKNNNPDNLMIVTRAEHAKIHREQIDRSKPVAQIGSDGSVIKIWPSAREAERNVKGCAYQNIYKCCIGERKTSGGFAWRYA